MAKYSTGAKEEVGGALHELKEGKLKSGTGKKVTSRKQAIAIGLSEAREKGEKVPAKKGAMKTARSKSASKTAGRTTASRKTATGATKSAAKKSTAKSATSKRGAAKKRSTK